MKGLSKIIIGSILCVSSSVIFADDMENTDSPDTVNTTTTTTDTTKTMATTGMWSCITDKDTSSSVPSQDADVGKAALGATCTDCTIITCTKK